MTAGHVSKLRSGFRLGEGDETPVVFPSLRNDHCTLKWSKKQHRACETLNIQTVYRCAEAYDFQISAA